MGELWQWLTETSEGGYMLLAVMICATGAFFYIMNWLIFINNLIPGRKWSSMVPPLGGLLIAVAMLVAGLGWWALIGLTDPFTFVLIYSLADGGRGKSRETDKKETEKEETEENGEHGN
ncbi:MAG: hypothetical protein K5876_01470 [Ruminiclostridium sp.]|nr:hypothetical protein [Ruminiclostridium sp.]